MGIFRVLLNNFKNFAAELTIVWGSVRCSLFAFRLSLFAVGVEAANSERRKANTTKKAPA